MLLPKLVYKKYFYFTQTLNSLNCKKDNIFEQNTFKQIMKPTYIISTSTNNKDVHLFSIQKKKNCKKNQFSN